MFGIDFFEIMVITVIGVVILGPEHMPRVALQIGKWSGKMRSAASQLGQAITQDENIQTLRREFDEGHEKITQPIKDGKSKGQNLADRLNAAVSTEKESLTDMFEQSKNEAKGKGNAASKLKDIEEKPTRTEGSLTENKTSKSETATVQGQSFKLQSPTPINCQWLELSDRRKRTEKLVKARLLPEALSRQTIKARHPLAKVQTHHSKTAKAYPLRKPKKGLGFQKTRKLTRTLSTTLKHKSHRLAAAQTMSAQSICVVLAPSKRPS